MKTENLNVETTQTNKPHFQVDEMKVFDPLEDEVQKLCKDLETEREQYLRLAAEYENYRRRTKKERKEFADEGKRSLLEELITIADDFDLALSHSEEKPDQADEGLKLIERRFQNLLLKNDVTSFDSKGEIFDPEIHEAFNVIAATEKHKSGTVHSELRRGYFWKGKLLRPAMVVVAQ